MHVHILGICGTFMGGIALLAREMGYQVSGSDSQVYPPMSTQLQAQGIQLQEGYDPAHLDPAPDLVVIGNALSRGNPAVEYVLNRGLPYISGPAFLSDYVLPDRWVIAVAGTHGKTTTSSLMAWILEAAGLHPGFLIGGIPENFGLSARLGQPPFFVVEADEYDTAFFDKRSKFVHYRPRTVILNNLEFDHADIFPDLAAIKRQFHHFVRIIPNNGLVVAPAADPHLAEVLQMGCWTPVEYFSLGKHEKATWSAHHLTPDSRSFDIYCRNQPLGTIRWALTGKHNVHNALAAVAAARHAGVVPEQALHALGAFRNVKRRMELRGEVRGIKVYDDFAHHPTAITTTLEGLRGQVGTARIIAVLEPRSNTMRMGIHNETLGPSLRGADQVVLYQPADLGWDLSRVAASLGGKATVHSSIPAIIEYLLTQLQPGDHVLIMSNGAFGGIHQKLLEALQT